MWHGLEPIHAGVYFAPDARAKYEAVGLKGYWMGYFASRSAAMGTPSAELVMATFYNFSERSVRRAIPRRVAVLDAGARARGASRARRGDDPPPCREPGAGPGGPARRVGRARDAPR